MSKKATVKLQYSHSDKVTEFNIDLTRVQENIAKAQYALYSMIMTDMVPYMPMQTGTFINTTRAMSAANAGSGVIVAAAPPYGRYLYEGKVMVDSATGRGPAPIEISPGEFAPRFRKGAKLTATNRPLSYSRHAHPNVTDHWAEKAKEVHWKKWLQETKKKAGGG